jgi:putative transposase
LYLVAVLDWYSRKVLAWQLSNAFDGRFCQQTLEVALSQGTPQVFNTDQGCQFTARAYTSRLEAASVAISMDGRGRALDNVFIERLWRSVMHEEVYRRDHASVAEAQASLSAYFAFYNDRRRHQSLGTVPKSFRSARSVSNFS